MWKLESSSDNKRVYMNAATGSKCETTNTYTDKEGNKWWSFLDLTSMPYTRSFAATKITSLYALGLSKDDLTSHISGLKTILKSTDADKYEKAYANVLDFESKASNATDAIKQMSSLVCVYHLLNDELIDSFDNALQIKKMGLLESDPEMHNFFLRYQISITEKYTKFLNTLSQIASAQ